MSFLHERWHLYKEIHLVYSTVSKSTSVWSVPLVRYVQFLRYMHVSGLTETLTETRTLYRLSSVMIYATRPLHCCKYSHLAADPINVMFSVWTRWYLKGISHSHIYNPCGELTLSTVENIDFLTRKFNPIPFLIYHIWLNLYKFLK